MFCNGALYQEIVYQNTGKILPFIIAVATKQKYSQRALLEIPTDVLSQKTTFLHEYLPHLQKIKNGEIEAVGCRSL